MILWAAALSSVPPKNNTLSSTGVKPPHRCLRSLAVSAKSRRRPSRPDNQEEEDVESGQNVVGVMGQAVLTAFESKAQQQKHSSSSLVRVEPITSTKKQQKTTEQQQESKLGTARERELSGSDVLWALQRASVEKAKKKKQQQSKRKQRKMDTNRQTEMKVMDADADADEDEHHRIVRPLCIKSEWDARLAELENRLEELTLMDV